MQHAEPEPLDPKVVQFVRKEQKQVERLRFRNPREKFEWLRMEQRGREMTDKEMRWLRTWIQAWINYADQFCEQWPEEDQVWLGKVSPSHFPQYVREKRK